MDSDSVLPSALYQSIDRFLKDNGLKKTAKAFKKEVNLDSVPGRRDNLLEVYNYYLKSIKKESETKEDTDQNNKKRKRENEETENSNNKDQNKKKQKKKKKKQKKTKVEQEKSTEQQETKPKQEEPKQNEQTNTTTNNTNNNDNNNKKNKKNKKKKQNKNQSSEKIGDSDTSTSSISSISAIQAPITPSKEETNQSQNGTNLKNSSGPFRRIKEDEVKFVKAELKDNSFEAKARGSNDWGGKANQILSTVKGKDFRHEKTKKKRGTYRGGKINDGVIRSVKFDD